MQNFWTSTILATVALVATVTARVCTVNPNRVVFAESSTINLTNTTINIAHEWDCTKFYECSAGACIPMDCPMMNKDEKLHFSPTQQLCDWPECSQCATQHAILKRHPNDCSKYNVEVNGKIIPKKCPQGLYFNETSKRCVVSEDAGCPYTIKMPDHGNCSRFYEISNGRRILMACHLGLHFNPATKICVPQAEAGCYLRNGPCDGIADEAVLIDPTSCSKYIFCLKGEAVYKTCPEGLYLNANARSCVNAEKATCDSPIIVADREANTPKYWILYRSEKILMQ